jgi:hypothetical protein
VSASVRPNRATALAREAKLNRRDGGSGGLDSSAGDEEGVDMASD